MDKNIFMFFIKEATEYTPEELQNVSRGALGGGIAGGVLGAAAGKGHRGFLGLAGAATGALGGGALGVLKSNAERSAREQALAEQKKSFMRDTRPLDFLSEPHETAMSKLPNQAAQEAYMDKHIMRREQQLADEWKRKMGS